MPGESIAVFWDALRRLGGHSRYIQQDGDRYWIDTSPNLNRTAEDSRGGYLRQKDELLAELNQLLAKEASRRGGFDGVHAAQLETSGIPAAPATDWCSWLLNTLINMGRRPAEPVSRPPAACRARAISPRHSQNTLVFLAPDEQNLDNLFQALADRRAWQRVIDEKLLLQITYSQANKAASKIEEATHAISARVPETWCHLLVHIKTSPVFMGLNGMKKTQWRQGFSCGTAAWFSTRRAVLRMDSGRFRWHPQPPLLDTDGL